MTRILVTGSRHGWNYQVLKDALDDALKNIEWHPNMPSPVLVHGNAPGVDKQAAAIWQSWGLRCEPHPARWEECGTKAGPMRNEEMVGLGADLCIAFLDRNSKGTADCLRRARRDGIKTIVYERTPDHEKNLHTTKGQMSLFGEQP